MPEYIILLHNCAINEDHMMYGSWDIRHNGQNFLSLWAIFCPFPRQPKKSKFWKDEEKKPLQIYITISHMRTTRQSYDVCSWDMERDRHNFLTFWSIFCPYPPNNPENQNFEKMKEKKSGDIFLLHVYTIKP